MKIFLVILEEGDYDYYDAFVIITENETKAIKYLKQKHPERLGGAEWSKGYKIKEIRPKDYKKTKIILDSFNAG